MTEAEKLELAYARKVAMTGPAMSAMDQTLFRSMGAQAYLHDTPARQCPFAAGLAADLWLDGYASAMYWVERG